MYGTFSAFSSPSLPTSGRHSCWKAALDFDSDSDSSIFIHSDFQAKVALVLGLLEEQEHARTRVRTLEPNMQNQIN